MKLKEEKCGNYECRIIRINLYWIIGGLILVIIALSAFIFYIKKNESVSMGDLISISSGLVSIALAVIAIAYAISESIKTKNDSKKSEAILEKVKDGLDKSNKVLDEVKEITNDMYIKVGKIGEAYEGINQSNFSETVEAINTIDEIESTETVEVTGGIEEKESESMGVEKSVNLEEKKSNKVIDIANKGVTEKKGTTRIVRRGDIFYADLSPVIGSEQGGIRPVVVVQNDISNKYSPTVVVVSITSQINKAKLPTHVELSEDNYNIKNSVVLVEQIRTLDKKRLKEKIGQINESDMKKIDKALLIEISLA